MLSRAVHAASPSTLRKLFVSLGFGKRFLLRWLLQGPGGTHKGQVCLVSPASFLVTHVSNLLGAYERDLSLPGTGPAHQVCWSCTSPALQSPILTQSTQRHQNNSRQRDAAPAGRPQRNGDKELTSGLSCWNCKGFGCYFCYRFKA